MLGEIILCAIIGLSLGTFIGILFDGLGGGPGMGSTNKQYRQDIEVKVREILKDGTSSTKQELQEWWDTYH